MANRIRCTVFHGVVGFGLLFATPLFAQSNTDPAHEPLGKPPKVEDAKGHFVGYLVGQNIIERNVNGVWVAMAARAPFGFLSFALESSLGITNPASIYFFFNRWIVLVQNIC